MTKYTMSSTSTPIELFEYVVDAMRGNGGA